MLEELHSLILIARIRKVLLCTGSQSFAFVFLANLCPVQCRFE